VNDVDRREVATGRTYGKGKYIAKQCRGRPDPKRKEEGKRTFYAMWQSKNWLTVPEREKKAG